MKLEAFRAIDWYVDDPLEYIRTPKNIAEKLEKQGIAFSVFDMDGCFGCGGLIFWPNEAQDNYTAEAWVRISRRGLKHRKSGLRAIKEGFAVLKRTCEVRMFCWVSIHWPEAQRLVKWLGFTKTEETRELNDSIYVMWEIKDGNHIDDSRAGSISHGADTTGQHDETASGSPSPNKRVQCCSERS